MTSRILNCGTNPIIVSKINRKKTFFVFKPSHALAINNNLAVGCAIQIIATLSLSASATVRKVCDKLYLRYLQKVKIGSI